MWSVVLFDISVSNYWWFLLVSLVYCFDLLFVFVVVLYPLYLCANNDKCFICLTVFLLFLISLCFLLWRKELPTAIVLRGYYLLVKLPFLPGAFLGHKFVQLQKILKQLGPYLYYKFAHQEYCLHNHGFEMEYLDDQ